MKKFNFLLFLLYMNLILNGRTASLFPQIQEVESIRISDINNGWTVSIMPNGSGSIGYGSNPMDIALSPEGTFSLEGIYSALAPKLTETSEKGDVAVFIRVSGTISTTARYTKPSVVKQIFEKARQQSTPIDKARFDALVKNHPIELKSP